MRTVDVGLLRAARRTRAARCAEISLRGRGGSEDPDLTPLYEDAIRDTIERLEATGSPVVTDGEQRK